MRSAESIESVVRSSRGHTQGPDPRRHRRSWPLGLCALALAIASAAPPVGGSEAGRTPAATIVVSSSTAASAIGLTLVEGVLHYRDKVYQVTLRGAQPTAGSTGKVYDLVQARNIEGSYKPVAGGLRNDRGVTIIFEPPIDLSGGQLQIDLSGRRYPKASTGQRGTVD